MLGYDHDRFWEQTPRTLSLTFEAHRRLFIRDHNHRVWLAYHTAAFGRTQKMGSIRKYLMRDTRMVSVNDQIDGLKRWVIATGGKVVYKESTNG